MRDGVVAEAPGRVNIIGEHTDYHDGFVLPTPIPQRTTARVTPRSDSIVELSSGAPGLTSGRFALGCETPGRGWIDYVQGTTTALVRHGFHPSGFSAHFESTIPIGAGVSSSAALEVSVLRALRSLFAWTFDDVELARIAQSAETDFVGAPVGVMDQMASSVGREGAALFLDTRSLEYELISIPGSIELMVIDSGISHAHAGGEYATRRRESFDAAARLGVPKLRDLSPSDLPRVERLPPVLARRARHIITENQRVLDAVKALRSGTAVELGRLVSASHASMRDDYQTSTREIDILVAIAEAHDAVFGARLTGGGFGGAIVAITASGAARHAAADICRTYAIRTGRRATVLVPLP